MAGYQPRHDTDPVWYNGQQVNTLTYASAQVGVLITAIHGWDERPDIRDVREDRAGDDGEWADNLFLGGRTITIEGEVMGSSWVNLQSRKRSLAAIFNPTSDEVLFKVPDPATVSPTTSYSTSGMTGYERVYARVIEAISFGDTLDPACQTFQVILRASDPRVYSDSETSTDSGTSGTAARTVTVDQSGTYETPPTITVTGPTGSSFSVSEPTSELSITMDGLTVASGETVSFDLLDRTIDYTATYEVTRLNQAYNVALWMLDESAGTTADNEEGTSAYDGTYNGTYTLNQSGFDTGIASVDLNGSSGYVSVPYNAALHTADFTLETWVNFDTLAADITIADCCTGTNKGFRLYFDAAANAVKVTYGTGASTSTVTVWSATTLTAGSWFCIALKYTTISAGFVLVVNGVARGFTSAAGYTPSTVSGFRFGSTLTGGSYLDGRIAAFAYYNGYINDIGLAALYEARYNSSSVSAYSYLAADTARWANLGTSSSTYTLASSGLNTGSKLNVSYRDARL